MSRKFAINSLLMTTSNLIVQNFKTVYFRKIFRYSNIFNIANVLRGARRTAAGIVEPGYKR